MDIFQMTTQISALSKSFLALRARKWSLASVLTEMIPQVATFFEYGATTTMTTLKVQFDSHRIAISYFYSLVPMVWNTFKCLRIRTNWVFKMILFIDFATLSILLNKSLWHSLWSHNLWVVILLCKLLEATQNLLLNIVFLLLRSWKQITSSLWRYRKFLEHLNALWLSLHTRLVLLIVLLSLIN